VREFLKIERAVVDVSRQSSARDKGQGRATERRRKRSEARNQIRARFGRAITGQYTFQREDAPRLPADS